MAGIRNKSLGYDWILVAVFISLLIIGWFMVFAALHDPQHPYAFLDFSTLIGKHTIWIIVSLIVFSVVLTIDWKFWHVMSFPSYGIMMVLLILVLVIGKEINGARSWFSLGPLGTFQPGEWAKFATALAISNYLSFKKSDLSDFRTLITSLILILFPAGLILLQPDFGSSIVYLSFFILLYRRGLSPWLFIAAFGLAAIFICSLIFGFKAVTAILALAACSFLIFELEKFNTGLVVLFFLLGSLFFLLWQNETTFMFIPSLLAMLYYLFVSFRKKNFSTILISMIVLIVGATFSFTADFAFNNVLKPHQQERINIWLQPEKCDPHGNVMNILHAKMAIGSGGFLGKGFLKGEMTMLNYVSQQDTDFIFTSLGEEQGFIGILGLVFLFLVLIIRCIIIAERANLDYIKNFGYAVMGIFFFHFTFNIGMTMGLLPVVGIPLPLISKGGSSLVAFSIMIAVLIRMDMARLRNA